MALAVGQVIKASEVAADFNTTVKTAIENLVVWKQSSPPPYYPFNQGANSGVFANSLTALDLTSLVGTPIKKTDLTVTLLNMAGLYTKVRMARVHTWRRVQSSSSDSHSYSGYNLTNFSGNNSVSAVGWEAAYLSPTVPNTATLTVSTAFMSGIIKASDIQTLHQNIYTAWDTFRNTSGNMIEMAAQYCHSNCHSSCHHNRF